jgi:pimeloyl-ACP methyl ester carboxylesterase
LSIRFAEGGNAGHDAILLSPWPESVFAFEQVWTRFPERAHLVAVDPPGFGGSERREELMNPKRWAQLRDLLPGIETPVRIVQGSDDQVVPPVNAEYLGNHLPTAVSTSSPVPATSAGRNSPTSMHRW